MFPASPVRWELLTSLVEQYSAVRRLSRCHTAGSKFDLRNEVVVNAIDDGEIQNYCTLTNSPLTKSFECAVSGFVRKQNLKKIRGAYLSDPKFS